MSAKGQRIGYVRVSSFDQNTDRQLEHLHADRIFTDKASGKDTERPQLKALIAYAREGDMIVVHSMDRLARNVDDLRRIVQTENKRGVSVQFIKENLLFTGEDSPLANLMLSVLGAVAQFERDLLKERQREGIALAKQRGAYRGRQKSLSPESTAELLQRVEAGEKKASLAREFKVSRETLYQYLRQAKSQSLPEVSHERPSSEKWQAERSLWKQDVEMKSQRYPRDHILDVSRDTIYKHISEEL